MPEAERALVEQILPRASVLTPNLPEARVLAAPRSSRRRRTGGRARGPAARRARSRPAGSRADRRPPRARVDLFATADEPHAPVEIEGERHPDGAAHGSGCTHSAALAAQLALGHDALAAARTARALAGAAIAGGLRDVGAGAGPVDVIGLAAHAGALDDGAPGAGREPGCLP